MVENGQRLELNQVSSTSVSCSMRADEQCAQAAGVSRDTVILWQSAQCQAGMRWPHQSWREITQSRIFSIQWKNVFSQLSGTKRMRPSRTASMAFAAIGVVLTNHCVETSGSTMVPQRSHFASGSL